MECFLELRLLRKRFFFSGKPLPLKIHHPSEEVELWPRAELRTLGVIALV